MKKYIISIILVGLLVFSFSLFNNFVWDDEEQIINNPAVHNMANFPQYFAGSTFNSGGAGLSGWYYKPLMTFSFALNYFFSSGKPFSFHLFSLLLHLTNAVLVFLIFSHFWKNKRMSFLFSCLFVVHPGISEAVFYISAVQEVLYTLFALLAVLFLIKTKNSSLLFLILSFLIIFSLFSKESGIAVIFIMFFYSLFFDKKKIPVILSSAAFSVLVYLFFRLVIARIPLAYYHIVPISRAPLFERLLTLPYLLFSYFRLIFFPVNLSIAQHFVIHTPSDWRFITGLFFCLILLVFGFRMRKYKDKKSVFFLSWFVFSLALVLNIFPLDMSLAERWLYFPLIGIFGIFGSLLVFLKKKNGILYSEYLLIGLIILFAARTIIRGFDWKDGLTLYGHDIKYSKDSFDLENNYGVELYRSGQKEKAKVHFENSVKLSPDWWTNYNNLGAYYQNVGNVKGAEQMYKKAVANGNYYLAYENLSSLLYQQEKYPEVIDFINQSLKRLPGNQKLLLIRVLSYYKMKDLKKAEESAYQLYLQYPSLQTADLYQKVKEGKSLPEGL